jgi:RHS repeat-associated protein
VTAGNVVRQTDPLGRIVIREYDRLDRLVAVKQFGGTPPTAAVSTTADGAILSEVQQVGFPANATIFGGTFTLTYAGQTTAAIAWNASAATVLAALEALPNIGFGDVAVTKINDTMVRKEYRLDFQGALALQNLVQVTVDSTNIQSAFALTDIEDTDVQGGAASEVQVVTLADATGGTFRLALAGEQTAPLAYDATAAQVESALEALTNIDDVAVAGSAGGPYTITFLGTHAGLDIIPLVTDAGSLTSETAFQAVQYTYDAVNNLLTVTDPLLHTTTHTYDNLDRLISTALHDPDGGGGPLTSPTSTFTYDAVSNLLTLTDPVGNVTSWTYDGLDRVTAETNDLGKTRTFKYDAVNNLVERVDRLGRKTVWEYDNRYRNTNEKWYDGATIVRTLSFAYRADGSLASAADPAALYSFGYDGLGRVTNEGQTLAGLAPVLQYESQFNAVSRRTQLQAKIGGTNDFQNQYAFDALHRLTSLAQQDVSGGNVVADKRIDFEYDAASAFTRIARYADQAASEFVANTFFSYDPFGRLSKLLHTEDETAPGSGWGEGALAGYEFTYDAANRITSINSFADGLTNYSYDNTDQLTAADHASITDETYSYDVNGNRTMSGYITTDNNRLTADGVFNYTYDDEGNRLTKTRISNSEKEEYTWDHRNRLTGVTFKNSGGTVLKTVLHTYDAFDRLIRSTVDPDGATGSAALVDAFFSWEADQINLDFDGPTSGDLAHRNLFNPEAIDQILAVEDVASLLSAGDVKWPLTDHLGTPRDLAAYNATTDDTTVANHRVYNSFGQLVSETNASFTIAFGFTGVLSDSSTSLNYHRARWLDPATGKWLSEDPIGFNGGDSNIVRYVANKPTRYADPSGLELPTHSVPIYPGKTVDRTPPPFGTDPWDHGVAAAGSAIGFVFAPWDEALDYIVDKATGGWWPFGIPTPGDLPDVPRKLLAKTTKEAAQSAPTKLAREAMEKAAKEAKEGAEKAAKDCPAPVNTSDRRMAVDEAIENGDINSTTLQRAGVTRPPRHHVFPQEMRDFFAEREFNDIDNYTIVLDQATHEAIHKWMGSGAWNDIMKARILAQEEKLGRLLNKREIMLIGAEVTLQLSAVVVGRVGNSPVVAS